MRTSHAASQYSGTVMGRFYGLDKHERFRAVTALVRSGDRILDVGGGKGDFFAFSRLSGVIADLMPARSFFGRVSSPFPFVPFDGLSLPFRNESFDIVVSLDTLEHVPRDKRPLILEEMQRVSKDRVVLTFPERHFYLPMLLSIATLYSSAGLGSIMKRSLHEHLLYGLPTAGEILSCVDPSEWAASQSSFFGRLSTLIWMLQLMLPLLATSRANQLFSNLLSNFPTSLGSERLIFLQRRRIAS